MYLYMYFTLVRPYSNMFQPDPSDRLELWEFPIQGPRQGDAAILQASRYSGASAVGLDGMYQRMF